MKRKMELRGKDFEKGRLMELTSHSKQWVVFLLAVLDLLLPVAVAVVMRSFVEFRT
jgi:CHASE1-domain containing sensor protein